MTLGVAPKRAKPRWLGLLVGVVALILVTTSIALAGPVGAAEGFEDDDGNLIDNPDAGIDWNSFDPISWLPPSATPDAAG